MVKGGPPSRKGNAYRVGGNRVPVSPPRLTHHDDLLRHGPDVLQFVIDDGIHPSFKSLMCFLCSPSRVMMSAATWYTHRS